MFHGFNNQRMIRLALFLGLFPLVFFVSPRLSVAYNHPLLIKFIIEYNLRAIEKGLVNGTYRGEEGILGIRPEIADSLGLKVYIDQDYLDASRLLKEADRYLTKAKMSMASREKAPHSGYHEKKIADYFISYRTSSDEAIKKLMLYHSKLEPGIDERLDESLCSGLIDSILEEGLKKADNRLRDGLGNFFNRCQGEAEKDFSLTPENVRFVNYVFKKFLENAPEKEIKKYDLDRYSSYRDKQTAHNWKEAAGNDIARFSSSLEAALKDLENENNVVDPLLFIALMKKESSFNPLSVSHVGAAGLTQIMPRTAKDMGMNNIHMPNYFLEAESLMKSERETREQAMEALYMIEGKDSLKHAKRARELTQKSLEMGRKRGKLFYKYRKDLLRNQTDERLQPAKAIRYGLRYFARSLRDQGGDISLALASYNAGPHRIKRFKGIPPYDETVAFRNRVLEFYRDYLKKAGGR